MASTTRIVLLAAAAAACGGDGPTTPTLEPLEAWACTHVAEGDVVDASLDRGAAPSVPTGRSPLRVNIVSGETNFLAFDVDTAQAWVLLADQAGALPAVWEGDARVELDPAVTDPSCDEDLPEMRRVELGAGPHHVEVGPVFQGNVWMVLGPDGG